MRIVLCVCLCIQWGFGVGMFESMRAYFWYKNGHYEQALQDYERIYAQHKLCHNAYNLANVYYKMGVYASAVRLYQEGLELPCAQSHYAPVWHNLGNALFALGRYVEAYHAFENAQNLKPNTATQQNLTTTRELLEQKKAIATIITKPKVQDSQEFSALAPLLAPQITKPQDANPESPKRESSPKPNPASNPKLNPW